MESLGLCSLLDEIVKTYSFSYTKLGEFLVKGQKSGNLPQVVEGKGNIKSANMSQTIYAIGYNRSIRVNFGTLGGEQQVPPFGRNDKL